MSQVRTIEIENARALKLLADQKKLVAEMNTAIDETEKIERTKHKIALKQQAIRDRLQPIVADKILELTKLNEFELVTKVKEENGKVIVEITDQVEAFREMLIEKNAKKDTTNNESETGGDTEDGGTEEGEGENKEK